MANSNVKLIEMLILMAIKSNTVEIMNHEYHRLQYSTSRCKSIAMMLTVAWAMTFDFLS